MDLYIARDGATALAWARGGGRAGFLCADWEPYEALRAAGLGAELWEDAITPELDRALMEKTSGLADSWRRHGDRDFTLFDGVSLGKPCRWLAWTLVLRPVFKFAAGMTAALEREGPRRLFVESGLPQVYRDVVESIRAARPGLGVEAVPSPGTEPENCTGTDIFEWAPPPLTLPPGKRLAVRAFNAFSAACSGVFGGRPRPAILASSYHSLEPLFELSGEKGPSFRYQFADLPPKRLATELARRDARILLSPRTPPEWSARDKAALAAIDRDWARAEADPDYRARFDWEGTPLWNAVGPRLRARAAPLLGPLAWAARGLAESWRRDPPSLVLIPSDGPPLQHLLTDLARSRGTPAVLLSHGLPAGYRHVMENQNPSHLLVWGKAQEALYRQAGSSVPREVVAVGNPFFDRYAGAPAAPPSSEPVRKVLVLTHPVVFFSFSASDSDPERQIDGILGGLREQGGFETTVKLHPAESLKAYNRRFAGRHPETRFIKDRGLAHCLADADLVVGSFSTALLEAMILGKPVLLVNLTRTDFGPPFDGNWGLPVVRAPEELRRRLEALATDPGRFRGKTLAAYPGILKDFAGPTDGTAARRVAEALSRIAGSRE